MPPMGLMSHYLSGRVYSCIRKHSGNTYKT